MKTFKDLLTKLNACEKAVEWAGDKTIKEVVETCPRGEWLLWLAYKVDIDVKPLTLAKAHCANTVRHLMDNELSIKAVDIAIAFGEGKATKEELDFARDDAGRSAAVAADAVRYTHADTNAFYAADAVYAACHTVTNDSYTAYVAEAAAATAVAYGAARAKNQMETADICRKYIGDLIIEKVNAQLKTTEQ